jgi:hypothetical protein
MFNGELRYESLLFPITFWLKWTFIAFSVALLCLKYFFKVAFYQLVWAFDLLLRHRHGFQTYFVSAQQRKKKHVNLLFSWVFQLIFTSHGSGFTFPGANFGQWFPVFEHSAASISGGLRSVLSGICIPSAQAFTGQHFALFDRRFSWIYSGHFATEFQFLIDVEKLPYISTS